MNDIAEQIQAAISVKVAVVTTDMSRYNGGISVEVYSNGDAGRTVVTRHKASDGVPAIVAAHVAERAPAVQRKSRKAADRVHRQVFGGR